MGLVALILTTARCGLCSATIAHIALISLASVLMVAAALTFAAGAGLGGLPLSVARADHCRPLPPRRLGWGRLCLRSACLAEPSFRSPWLAEPVVLGIAAAALFSIAPSVVAVDRHPDLRELVLAHSPSASASR